jgi:hypothetical protein
MIIINNNINFLGKTFYYTTPKNVIFNSNKKKLDVFNISAINNIIGVYLITLLLSLLWILKAKLKI